jgi:hypothetical protein
MPTGAIEVTICDPITANIKGVTGDFDDPNAEMAVQKVGGGDEWMQFNKGRLSIQVLFYFKLVIPFVNMMIYQIATGLENAQTMRLMRMSKRYNLTPRVEGNLAGRAAVKSYYLPIRSNWSMRMMSNYLKKYPLPSSNLCRVPWGA